MPDPVVSIVMPCYNKAKFLEESIASVALQSFEDFELIIVDDKSTDSSCEIAGRLSEGDTRMILIRNDENKGANYCRNAGIEKAKGEYLIFFDADDVLGKTCLEKRVRYMRENPALDFSVHTLEIFNKMPGDSSFRWNPVSKKPLRDFLKHDLPWQTMQPIWRKEFVKRTGGFDENFKRLQDVEFHTRVLLRGEARHALVNAQPDCYYRTDHGRIDFGNAGFMDRCISSAMQYCSKYAGILKEPQRRYLLGTIYQTYLSLCLSYKAGQINAGEFEGMEEKILSHELSVSTGNFKKFLLKAMKFYNLRLFRIPGLNRFFKKCLLA